MGKGKAIWILFALMVIAQLAIPALMIKGQEDVLQNGKEFKFNTEPVDPYDLMRGKYVTLRFSENRARATTEIQKGDLVYITIGKDDQGYAFLKDVLKELPLSEEDYLELTLNNYINRHNDSIDVHLPFDRFYMEESKAELAEDLYRESIQSVQNESCAVVMIKDGQAVLKDILIDGVPIKEAVEAIQAEIGE